MGIDYRAFVYDDFDWSYANGDKEVYKEKLLRELEEAGCKAEVEAEFYNYIILDLGRNSPAHGKVHEVLIKNDIVHYSSCTEPLLKRLE